MLTAWEKNRNKKVMAAIEASNRRQALASNPREHARLSLMRSGICDESGNLTKEYGNGSNPNTAARSEKLARFYEQHQAKLKVTQGGESMKVSLGNTEKDPARYSLSSAENLQRNTLLRCYCTFKGEESFQGFAVVTSSKKIYHFRDSGFVSNTDFTFEKMAAGETLILEQE